MIILGGSSRQSLIALRGSLDKALNGLSAADAAAISNDLFTALLALDGSVGLRRALTDPSRDAAAKGALISNLFGKNIGQQSLALLADAVALRWSAPSQFADAIEQLAVEAEASSANIDEKLEAVANEIFDFSRLLIENPALRQALNTAADTEAHKAALLNDIFKGKYSDYTVRLLIQALRGQRGRNIERTINAYSHAVTARRNRVNAHIRTSIALSDAQKSKLGAALTKQIGQPVHLNIEIDPSVLGGLSIRFADEVIDGTIVNRLAEASRALAG
jgi:F-type H+-transporting ATPase subunit delta